MVSKEMQRPFGARFGGPVPSRDEEVTFEFELVPSDEEGTQAPLGIHPLKEDKEAGG